MARDLDFRVRSKPPAPPARPTANVKAAKRYARWWVVLMVIGLLALAAALWLEFRTGPSVKGSQKDISDTTTTVAVGLIRIYDGGAGEQKCKALASALTDSGYRAEYAGKALDDYRISELWHNPAHSAEAVAVAKLTPGPTETRQTQLKSDYGMLLFLAGS
jgi:hypothetical protein